MAEGAGATLLQVSFEVLYLKRTIYKLMWSHTGAVCWKLSKSDFIE